MFICIKRSHLLAFLLCSFLGLTTILWTGHAGSRSRPVFAVREGAPVTIVIDPGHGGEDGGAVSPDGVEESQINLEIALRINDILRFAGQHTRMTRETDVSIHDAHAVSAREKKVSDLKNRVQLVNGTENAVLLSIHQNSLPSSTVTHGAQAFWNRQEGAQELAEAIQQTLNGVVNTHRAKQAKAISDSIYLMKQALVPGVLVECGFLSHTGETALLQEGAYQEKLAMTISAGLLRGLAGEDSI